MERLPRTRCWFVGQTDAGAIERSYVFNESWESGLSIGSHDCRDYTNGRFGGASYAEETIFGAAKRQKLLKLAKRLMKGVYWLRRIAII
ncbi:hypothetical protein QQ045_014534 [Rhodiola kirilowii]